MVPAVEAERGVREKSSTATEEVKGGHDSSWNPPTLDSIAASVVSWQPLMANLIALPVSGLPDPDAALSLRQPPSTAVLTMRSTTSPMRAPMPSLRYSLLSP